MLKKLHWGHGIFIFYVVFVLTLLSVLIASTRVDRSLVLDDYYALDLDYQNRYNDISNELDAEHLTIHYSKDKQSINLQFDHTSPATGTIHLYRPSNAKRDKTMVIAGNTMAINSTELEKGLWKIKVEWTGDNKKFYKVEEIYI